MIKQNEEIQEKLTPRQYGIMQFIINLLDVNKNKYEIDGNNIFIDEIDIFKLLHEKLNSSNILYEINYTITEIDFFNKKNIIIEFDKGEYLKIILDISIKDYFKSKLKNILG